MSDQNHFDEERISNAVLSFVNAKTWAESKAIVQAHQDDLLTPAADQIFEALLVQYKDDEKARRLLERITVRCFAGARARGSMLHSQVVSRRGPHPTSHRTYWLD